MKSVFLEKAGKIYIKDIADKVCGEGEALIKVKSAGICGSDLGAFRGTNPLVNYPTVIGHEIAGEVIQIAKNERGIEVGDHVILDPYIYCGTCYPCSLGKTNCCESLMVLGVQTEGGMMEYRNHPTKLLHKVSSNLEWKVVPIVEPLCIALHSLKQSEAKSGEHLVVIGAGPIGLLIAMAALNYGVDPILIDIVEGRLDFAKKLGVKYTINSDKTDAIKEIALITKNLMAECVIEASGSNAAIPKTLDFVSYAGRIVFTGWPKSPVEFATSVITKKELTIRGSRTSNAEFPEAVRLIENNILDVRPLISKVIGFEELPAIFPLVNDNPMDFIKVIGIF